ncbi:hypothetical protein [Aliikangiella coralliicola]|uniref:STAS/SEC14 domain-containing protein n=1 Tax=Aliikangiella coralliicola TaxID=2592383 RepID=A0A545UJH1_9GAMM|nr:hypothetical protein [Aliikangiella coralliicola]TQV89615.1 hypothetical protein FLL46_01655 [Aliikangiella coralliicola]
MTHLRKSEALANTAEKYFVEIDSTNSLAHLVYFGSITLKDVVGSFSALIRHPDFVHNMDACYDLSQAIVEIDLNETEIFSHFVEGLRDRRGANYRIAFICGDEMTKMLVDFYRLFLARTDIELFNTDTKSSAMDWLCEPA